MIRKEERSFFCYEIAISKISVPIRVETLIIISNTITNNNETLYNYISHPPTAFHHKAMSTTTTRDYSFNAANVRWRSNKGTVVVILIVIIESFNLSQH